jgi:hypothetical protein
MHKDLEKEVEPKLFNVMQIIAFDVIVTALLLVSTLSSGMSVVPAVMLSWLGGAVITFGCVLAAYALSGLRRSDGAEDAGADQDAGLIRAWEEDLSLDAEEAAMEALSTGRIVAARTKSTDAQVAEWDEDSRLEAIEATVVLGRKPTRNRRYRKLPHTGKERRTANR